MEAASTTTGPTSFAEAFAADAPSASPPPSDTSAAPTGADTTDSPALSDTGDTPQLSGEPPRERWDSILSNARTKAREEAEAQWKPYEWARTINRDHVEHAARIGQQLQTDPATALDDLLTQALTNPQYAPAVRSVLGRYLAQARGQAQQPPAVDLNPIPVQLEDGRTVPLFTAEQHRALLEQELAKFREELAPVQQTAKELKAAKEQAARQQEADSFATTFFGDLSKLPDFDALKPEIAKRLASTQLTSDHPKEVEAAVYRIYMDLSANRRTTDIAKAKSEQLDDLRRQAAASTSPNPGSAAPSTTRTPSSFYDSSLKW